MYQLFNRAQAVELGDLDDRDCYHKYPFRLSHNIERSAFLLLNSVVVTCCSQMLPHFETDIAQCLGGDGFDERAYICLGHLELRCTENSVKWKRRQE